MWIEFFLASRYSSVDIQIEIMRREIQLEIHMLKTWDMQSVRNELLENLIEITESNWMISHINRLIQCPIHERSN